MRTIYLFFFISYPFLNLKLIYIIKQTKMTSIESMCLFGWKSFRIFTTSNRIPEFCSTTYNESFFNCLIHKRKFWQEIKVLSFSLFLIVSYRFIVYIQIRNTWNETMPLIQYWKQKGKKYSIGIFSSISGRYLFLFE